MAAAEGKGVMLSSKPWVFAVAALVILVLFSIDAAPAEAQDRFSVPQFAPGLFGGRYLGIDDAATLRQWGFGFGVYYDYAPSLLTYYLNDEPEFDAIGSLQSLHANTALGLFDWWSLGVQMPFHAMSYREIPDFNDPSTRSESKDSGLLPGDLRVEMKFRALVQERHGIGLAVLPFVRFPTGDADRYVGEDRATGGGRLAIERDFGPVDLTLNGGYLVRGDGELLGVGIGNAVLFGAAAGHRFDSGLGLGIEFAGRSYTVDDTNSIYNTPMELMGVIQYRFGAGPRLIAGGGPGLTTGVGTPPYRIAAGIDYYSVAADTAVLTVETVDSTGARIEARVEVSGPVDRPAADSSGRLRLELPPGTYTVTATAEGRSPADIVVALSKGRRRTVTLTLPIIKASETGVRIVAKDACSGNGVNAKVKLEDGNTLYLSDGEIKKPLKAGPYQGTASANGYADQPVTFTVENGQTAELTLTMSTPADTFGTPKIAFAVGSADIVPSMETELDTLAEKLRRMCAVTAIVVEGHTDDTEARGENLELSQQRARAVADYLIAKGVDASKVTVHGLGATQPVASNAMSWGRDQNRRVEIHVEE